MLMRILEGVIGIENGRNMGGKKPFNSGCKCQSEVEMKNSVESGGGEHAS